LDTNTLANKRLKIAIIGGGVAGNTAAYLLSKKHHVTIFEKENHLGGHTNTIMIEDGPDKGTPVDTGFIVLNDDTYPCFKKLLREIGIQTRPSTMSFSYWDQSSDFVYAGNDLNGLFARRKNIISPNFWRFLSGIPRFNRICLESLDKSNLEGLTLEEFVERHHFSDALVWKYLIPMTAAIWSTPPNKTLEFPAETLVRFFYHHGLLKVIDRPVWKTVVGGSFSYVKRIRQLLQTSANDSGYNAENNHSIHLNSSVQSIKRGQHVEVITADNQTRQFDRVVIATHADQALKLLEDPSKDEQRLLSPWRYTANETVLHTDESVLPPQRQAWSSWNFVTEPNQKSGSVPLTMTYQMNILQGLRTKKQYCVTLNRLEDYPEKDVIKRISYTHPRYDFDSYRTQSELPKLNGERGTYYCGSYFRYGFHEDAAASAVDVARCFGITL